MPENVPPKETAKADGLNPNEQAPGVPRAPSVGPVAEVPQGQPGSVKPGTTTPQVGDQASRKTAGAGPDDHPGEGFVRIKWKNKIGGNEADQEWAEERRAHNLVGSGHAEIVKQDDKAK